MPTTNPPQDEQYLQAIAAYGPPLVRLARAYEADPDARQDLLQDVHLALWRSFASFDNRCSLRTWVYRVAHNAAASHVLRSRRAKSQTLVSLDEIEEQGGLASKHESHPSLEQAQILERIYALIQSLNPFDRQVILLYLEGVDAASIGEVTGISAGNVATKIHRIKTILIGHFRNGENNDQR
ncbi:MAG: sigma-70 family RNA polymerase sigma factor [Terracidiphilus sp.]|jgi:RNA polymerase sigma-70 factor (ECF subfamily)